MQRLHKLLVANRGEIACRIARTARRLGLAVATVHSDVDAGALHVREIGESHRLGAAPASDSYLNIDAVLAAARRAGADAIHPGYGFLSENAAFARAVEAAGLVFIGPRADTIERLGGKASAKREAARLGLPVVPGSDVGLSDPAALAAQVRSLPLPVLLKAVAGGGGRGMALIDTLAGLEPRIDGAMREALNAFGNGELIVERYLPRVRHIEVQIAGDGHGNAIHLFERECTLQRRHQKLVEEAPAAALPMALREALWHDARRLAADLHYRGLGTVEFIVADGVHHFLEVNPRLQVEHPVTEAVTGLDLVELQLRIADEGRLPLAQTDLRCIGHAFEARLCAEDASAGFRPSTGRIGALRLPTDSLRVDAGVAAGDAVTPYYDSMVAKLISHAGTREEARQQLIGGLQQVLLLGLTHNAGFLQQMLQWPETLSASFHTRLVDERVDPRVASAAGNLPGEPPLLQRAAVALAWLQARRAACADLGCWGQWAGFTGWRASTADSPARAPALLLRHGGREWPVRLGPLQADGTLALALGDEAPQRLRLDHLHGDEWLLRGPDDSWRLTLQAASDEGRLWRVAGPGGDHEIEALDWVGGAALSTTPSGELCAPMMGKVVAVQAAVGDALLAGQTVVVLESMKMELRVHAPFDATLAQLRCSVGAMVERGTVLAVVQAQAV
jgi:3-methylcrotonyl-CoA carboxylase alpha subunit